mmetsp:Transcript_62467/g.202514  ORF Transcript_62467/g.202514 Transcript_62467/m.202514 type:complete len:226 (-) Transcript_62467:104-781(-)
MPRLQKLQMPTSCGAPRDRPAFAPRRNRASLESLLDAFQERALDESLAAPVAWDCKLGPSIFSDEEILARPPAGPGDPPPLWTPRTQALIPNLLIQNMMCPAWWQPAEFAGAPRIMVANMTMPTDRKGETRAVRRVRPFCRVFDVEEARGEACPICLELLSVGQLAWRLPCLHQLHDGCAEAYFTTRGSRSGCPVCRCDVRGDPPQELSSSSSSGTAGAPAARPL